MRSNAKATGNMAGVRPGRGLVGEQSAVSGAGHTCCSARTPCDEQHAPGERMTLMLGTVGDEVAPLIGREQEQSLLTSVLDEVAARGEALVLRGEAGIGKSRLLSDIAQGARERGMSVLTTTGVQSEAHLPFAGLHQLLRPVRGRAAELPAVQRAALNAAFGLTDEVACTMERAGATRVTSLRGAESAPRARGARSADRARTPDRPACGRGAIEPGDRAATVPLASHDQHAPVPDLPEAWHHFAR